MFEDKKEELIKYAHIAGVQGFTPGISGNVSCRCDDKIIISATNSSNGFLGPDDLVVIDFEGNLVEGNKKPSSEKLLHIEYYKLRPEINSVFHFHSPYLTAFAASGTELNETVLPEIVYCFGKIPLADYALPGSIELVHNTSKYFRDFSVILMANHGVIACGKDIKEAYLNIELCEAYAKTIICSKILGGAKILSESNIEKILSLKNQ